jgi:hypothetical protein
MNERTELARANIAPDEGAIRFPAVRAGGNMRRARQPQQSERERKERDVDRRDLVRRTLRLNTSQRLLASTTTRGFLCRLPLI